MDLKEAIYRRRAVREYTAEPVDEDRRGYSGAERGQSTAVVILRSARPGRARPHIERSEGAYAANLACGAVAPFSGTAEQSGLQYFLSCAGARLDIERD